MGRSRTCNSGQGAICFQLRRCVAQCQPLIQLHPHASRPTRHPDSHFVKPRPNRRPGPLVYPPKSIVHIRHLTVRLLSRPPLLTAMFESNSSEAYDHRGQHFVLWLDRRAACSSHINSIQAKILPVYSGRTFHAVTGTNVSGRGLLWVLGIRLSSSHRRSGQRRRPYWASCRA
jgi:hypothetical protein